MKGCTELQGRYYSMPVPPNEIAALIIKIANGA
jgi:EAL domain-containing protein (putative c-di-GMP-specific phosphodiesterase class I)